MKRILINGLFLLIISGCTNKKEDKITNLKLLFTTTLTDNSFGGNNDFNSKLALSDTIFVQEEYIMTHSAGYGGTPETSLYIKGRKVSGSFNFDSLVEKYHLREINLQDMVKYKNDEFSISEYNRYGIKPIIEKVGKNKISLKKLKNENIIQYIDSTSNKNVLHISNHGTVSTFHIKSHSEMSGSFIKLYDINGDGKEEIFVLSPQSSYWGFQWFTEVYEIEY